MTTQRNSSRGTKVSKARIIEAVPTRPVISVDGSFGAPGLNLSHWPGNSTPKELRHDLSCGIALNFARLSASEREAYHGGNTQVVNNHYDTDGCCAAFSLLYPEIALLLEERLLAIATSGDFFRVLDEDAFCCDRVITKMADPACSPIARELIGLDDCERWTRAQAEVLKILPDLCAGGLELLRLLWEDDLRRLLQDLERLDGGRREENARLDLSCWLLGEESGPAREGPGRHALFTRSEADRVLVLTPDQGGTRTRLVVSTQSWFDLPKRTSLPRPDLLNLAQELNRVEGLLDSAPVRWRAQGPTNASPELWFGTQDLDAFAEHNSALETSSLPAHQIKQAALAALSPSL